MKKTYRTINYYELSLIDNPTAGLTGEECFQQTFASIINMAHHRQEGRYIAYGGRFIFIQDITIDPVNRILRGKLRSVKTDVKPEIINMLTDEARSIDTAEDEGIVETSHFVINYSRRGARPLLAFEYNRGGGSVIDLVGYIQRVGREHDLLTDVSYVPIGRASMEDIKNHIRRCSEIKIRVHKENVDKIEAIDADLFTAIDGLKSAFHNDYVTVTLDYNYRQRTETREGSNFLEKIINRFINRPDEMNVFESFTFSAEDETKNSRLEAFDLLINKQNSHVHVQLKEGHSTVVSHDIFDKIEAEITRKRLLGGNRQNNREDETFQ